LSKNVTKMQLNKLLTGTPKRITRGSIARIKSLAADLEKNGIAFFPYYSKTQPDHDAFKGADTRRLLEREVGPFFYATGNWPHLFEGVDTCAVWKDATVNDAMKEAGFNVREYNTAKRNLADDADTSADVSTAEVE
jgi:hypothetical protein